MAELLIRAKTNGADPTVYWQRGHVVYVKLDGSTWGAAERPPEFYVVRVKGSVDEWWARLREQKQIGTDSVNGSPVYTVTPPKIIDVDAPAPPDRASARIPTLRRQLLRRPMSQRLNTGEKLILHRKGMPVRRIF